MPSPYDAIAAARATLTGSGISPSEAAIDAEVLARHVLGWDRARLLVDGRDSAPPGFERDFQELVRRRMTREPVALITGHREFWGLEFEVTKDVLVPRPETELLVEEAVAHGRTAECRLAIDVGTGSGCIAIALTHELRDLRVIAVDSSRAALQVAERNAVRNGVSDRIEFLEGDLLENISQRAGLIVSNPPYVADSDAAALPPEVVRFEPHTALFGGADGLDLIRRLLVEAPAHLAPQGRLIVEFGFGQDAAVRQLACESGWTVVRIRMDLQGIPRTAVLSRPDLQPLQ